MKRGNIYPISRLCPNCRAQLFVEEIRHYADDDIADHDWTTYTVFCPQCSFEQKHLSSEKALKKIGLQPEVLMKMIVVPPLDYIRDLPQGYRTDLYKIPEKKRPWAYIAGKLWIAGPGALSVNQYCIIIYTCLSSNGWLMSPRKEEKYYWNLEKCGDRHAGETTDHPLILPDEDGIWKAPVDVGFAYFILVVVRGFRYPGFFIKSDVYEAKFPFESLEGVVLTKLIVAKEIFHPGIK